MVTLMNTLDLDAVQAFVLVADMQSFTRAAEALDTTQSAVSLKLKRLETHLDRRLLERTPRQVRLSMEGQAFLTAARELLAAHDRAWSVLHAPPRRLRVGFSGHIAGASLPALLARVAAHDPALVIEVRVATSAEVLASYDAGLLDAAYVLHHTDRQFDRQDGEVLFEDDMDWFGLPDTSWTRGEPLRLAMLAPPCGLRTNVIEALDQAGIGWLEVFVGDGVSALSAAVTAGLAVGAMGRRAAPASVVCVREKLGLPALQPTNVVLYRSVHDERSRSALRVMSATLRAF